MSKNLRLMAKGEKNEKWHDFFCGITFGFGRRSDWDEWMSM